MSMASTLNFKSGGQSHTNLEKILEKAKLDVMAPCQAMVFNPEVFKGKKKKIINKSANFSHPI